MSQPNFGKQRDRKRTLAVLDLREIGAVNSERLRKGRLRQAAAFSDLAKRCSHKGFVT